MEPQERHYNIFKLNRLFAIASVILLFSLGLMIWDDYSREWKDYQKEFQALEIEKTRIKYDIETNKLQKGEEYQKLLQELKEAGKNYLTQCSNLSSIEKEIKELKAQNEILNQQYRVKKAELDAAKFEYEEALGKHEQHLEKSKAIYEELNKTVIDLKIKIEESDSKLAMKSQIFEDCQKTVKELDKQKKNFSKQAEIFERKLKKIDPNEMIFTNRIADLIRDLPVIDFANPKLKIEQIVLNDITDDVNFMRVPKVDRCITCHQGITNPDYENAPQPFKTHPNLPLFLSKDSPHPLEEFGCTVCHGGRGRGINFVTAVHTPASLQQRKEWEDKYHWHEYHHWETPMYPLPYVEAGCFKCHSGQSVIKGAEKLNLGLNLMEKAGCYACHLIEKYKDWPKPGPDLRHLSSKVSESWVYLWLQDPRSFQHNTWMPSFFGQSNNNDPESVQRVEQEIHSIVHYLFATSKGFELTPIAQEGNPQKGEEIVASIGCFACHKTESENEAKKNDKPKINRESLLREQGPNLIALGSKTEDVWLYNWLKDPHRYHPETKMPNLRLTDQEAADVAVYLAQDKNINFSNKSIPPVKEDIVNKIVSELLQKDFSQAQTRQRVSKMTLEEKLLYAGEKLIGHYGCYSCHNINGFENIKPIGTELTEEGSKAPDKLDFGFIDIEHSRHAWFTQKLKDPRIFDQEKIKAADEKLRMPNYYFSDEEVEAIITALLGFVKDKPSLSKIRPRTPKNLFIEEGQRVVRQFNCQGCHMIEGEGGAIQPKVVEWLVKYDNRTEGEAEAVKISFSPPNLIGEGKKVQTQWLFDFLHEPVTVRPWLKIRMPTYHFSVAELNSLVKYFNALDDEEFPFTDVGDYTMTKEHLETGQKLFSNDYFGCAQCHIVGDKMPAGSPDSWAPDFAISKSRLKPQWIIEWIKNPQALSPGTKMPTFFDPNNFETSGPEDVLQGDENRQIKVLRDYILTLAGSAPIEQPPLVEDPNKLPQSESVPLTPSPQ